MSDTIRWVGDVLEVELTPEQMAEGEFVGRERERQAVERKATRARRQAAHASLGENILGAQGELAGSLATGLPWTGRLLPAWLLATSPDIGDDVDVKTTPLARGHMLVTKEKPDAWRYIHATAEASPVFRLRGWLFGHECKRPEWYDQEFLRARRAPTYGVPEEALRKMATFAELVAAARPIATIGEAVAVIRAAGLSIKLDEAERLVVAGWLPAAEKATLWSYFRANIERRDWRRAIVEAFKT